MDDFNRPYRPLKRRRRYGNITGRSPLMRGPVAQGIEQRFPGPCVAGSNPARPASALYSEAYDSSRPFPLQTVTLSPELQARASVGTQGTPSLLVAFVSSIDCLWERRRISWATEDE